MLKGLGKCALTILIALAQPARADLSPVLDTDFPDPFVLETDQGLVAYATNTVRNKQRINVQVSRSLDGAAWTPPVEAMPQPPAWARRHDPDIWAPEVVRIGARYVLYFSARHATLKRPDGLTLCVGAAVASSPTGPFKPQPKPLTCGERHGLIDASPFREGERLWLYVKTDGNCCGEATSILALRLAADGLQPAARPIIVQGLTNDQPWEGAVVEAPQMVMHLGRHYLFFAANDYGGSHYATGYALCDSSTGPCRDAEENPILSSASAPILGPGHPSVFTFKGKTFVAVHGWRTSNGNRHRAMYILNLQWLHNRPHVTFQD